MLDASISSLKAAVTLVRLIATPVELSAGSVAATVGCVVSDDGEAPPPPQADSPVRVNTVKTNIKGFFITTLPSGEQILYPARRRNLIEQRIFIESPPDRFIAQPARHHDFLTVNEKFPI
jgi:hypothetical protein